jgi:hypothetical protein
MSFIWANKEPVVTPKKNVGLYSDDEEDYSDVFYNDSTCMDSIETLNKSNPSLLELFEKAENQYYDSINYFIVNSVNFIYNIPTSSKI